LTETVVQSRPKQLVHLTEIRSLSNRILSKREKSITTLPE